MEQTGKNTSITRELVEARLVQLMAEQAQAQATLNAYDGAIQDCKYWLAVLENEPAEVNA